MPGVTFEFVLEILIRNGFSLHRQKGSHCVYKGMVNGRVQVVVLAIHRKADYVDRGTLGSIIRQCGLPKSLFRR